MLVLTAKANESLAMDADGDAMHRETVLSSKIQFIPWSRGGQAPTLIFPGNMVSRSGPAGDTHISHNKKQGL